MLGHRLRRWPNIKPTLDQHHDHSHAIVAAYKRHAGRASSAADLGRCFLLCLACRQSSLYLVDRVPPPPPPASLPTTCQSGCRINTVFLLQHPPPRPASLCHTTGLTPTYSALQNALRERDHAVVRRWFDAGGTVAVFGPILKQQRGTSSRTGAFFI